MSEWTGKADDDQIVRATLGRLLFSGDETKKSVTVLSGGEKGRMIYGKLMLTRPNVLLLDEPTNHMDMETIESLQIGLEKYPGTIVFVSHDREFVGSLATRIIELKGDGNIADFSGTYDEYLKSQGSRSNQKGVHDGKDSSRSRAAISAGRRTVRRDRRSVARKLLPGLFRLDLHRVYSGLSGSSGSRSKTWTRSVPQDRTLGARRVLYPQGRTRPTGRRSSRSSTTCPQGRRVRAESRRGKGRESISRVRCRRLHYLSVPPNAALSAVRMLAEAGLVEGSRIIMEKPFGTDLKSAVALNAKLHEVFKEEQIFRIDHFLGKEAAQNILAFRFANGLFEPIWNRNFIDHIQIDVPETLGLGKRRVLRGDRRLSRHGRHPSVPDPRVHRDGGADVAGALAHQRGKEQGVPQPHAGAAR